MQPIDKSLTRLSGIPVVVVGGLVNNQAVGTAFFAALSHGDYATGTPICHRGGNAIASFTRGFIHVLACNLCKFWFVGLVVEENTRG